MRNCSKNRRNGIRNTLKFLLDYMRAAPACSIAASAADLVIALLPSAISVATAMVTDRIAGGFGAAFAAGAAALLVLLALNQGLYYISDLLNDYAFNRAQYRMRAAFLDKVSQLQLIEFEKTEMLDRSHRLDKWLKDCPNVYYITDTLSKVEVNSLIASADVFVSLHRAEGFGLVMAEAMIVGTPVIATNWSSNTEFMDNNVACMVDCGFTKLEKDCPPYKKGAVWADPDIRMAARYMRELYKDKNFYEKIRRSAKLYINEKLSMEQAVGRLRKRIGEIYGPFERDI